MYKPLSKLIFSLLLILVLVFLSYFFSRQNIKQILPREGEVEVVGNVYTPFLLLDSTLYFLKRYDENLDLLFSRSNCAKAKAELVFANKRLLELEMLVRKGNFNETNILLDEFNESLSSIEYYLNQARDKNENTEEVMWQLQESALGQQIIFQKIIDKLPDSEQKVVLKAQTDSAHKYEGLLAKLHYLE